MTGGAALDALLCVLLVAVALGAVLVRDLFAAVVFFVTYGLFVAVAWARLGAVDVALAEAAIGAGLTGVLLVRTLSRLHTPRAASIVEPGRRGVHVPAAVLCLAVFCGLAWAVVALPEAPGLGAAVASELPRAGVGNPVTAVLLNFRGYDTLLETIVLLVALVGVWSLATDSAWGAAPGIRDHARPDGIMAGFARLLPPAGLLVGVHLFWAGAEAPGGAFQAGTILASVWLLATMSGISRAPSVESRGLRAVLLAGPALFLAVAAAALPGHGLLVFPPQLAKPLILTVEAALTLSIAATLALLVMGPPEGRSA